jgi:hypothetical protein
MSNQEKSVHLKKCLKTIGIHSPHLSRFIQDALDRDKQHKKLMNKLEAAERRLDRLQAEIVNTLLQS